MAIRDIVQAAAGNVGEATDPYFNYTTLLLPGNGTNGKQNNTFLDSSANNFTVTRNGSATQGTFSPFSQPSGYWSAHFDGSGDYLESPYSTGFDFGAGDFTVEGWWNLASLSSAITPIAFGSTAPSSGSDLAFFFYMDGSSNEVSVCSGSNYYSVTGWTSFTKINQWQHFAFVRQGSTLRLYLDGVQRGTAAGGVTINNNTGWTLRIGTYTSSSRFMNGYLSNIRLIKGTCQYLNGTTFIPSTTPLTAVSGTSLLTCQQNRIRDASANSIQVTKYGNSSTQAFSPFEPIDAYDPAVNGGSSFFGNPLTSASLSLSPTGLSSMSVWTIEFWGYNFSGIGDQPILGPWGPNLIRTSGTTLQVYLANSLQFSESGVWPLSQWNHAAITNDGSTLRLYTNGVLRNTNSPVTINMSSMVVGSESVGATTNDRWNGFISGFRVLNGTALYTGSSYTIPTAPPTAITNTAVLLNFTNAGITDATAKNDLQTIGTAQISTAQSKFGGGSMYFDGSSAQILVPNGPNFDLGSGSFTIEAWVNPSTSGGTYGVIVSKYASGFQDSFYMTRETNNTVRFGISYAGSGYLEITSSSALTNSAWTHIAAVRNVNTVTLYFNGVSVGTATATDAVKVTTSSVVVGNLQGYSQYFSGYIDDLRITKGVARYTSAFTPPDKEFPLL